MGFSLTDRDAELVGHIAQHRLVRLADLAAAFFAVDPRNGRPSAHAVDACARRLRTLAASQVVELHSIIDGGETIRVVGLGSRAELVPGISRKALPAARSRMHHLRTTDAARAVAARLEQRGLRVVGARYEQDLRSAALRGKRTRSGDRFEAFADAVVVAEDRASLVRKLVEVAVEYVTSKYTDADIRKKTRAFKKHSEVVWVADNANTARRVERLTGARCEVLP